MTKHWFSLYEVTPLNIIVVCMSIVERSNLNEIVWSNLNEAARSNLTEAARSNLTEAARSNLINMKLFRCKSLYANVVKQLVTDGIINNKRGTDLINRYNYMEEEGIVDDFIRIICNITNDPNLINNKWIPDNIIGRTKNECFPCRSKSNPK